MRKSLRWSPDTADIVAVLFVLAVLMFVIRTVLKVFKLIPW